MPAFDQRAYWRRTVRRILLLLAVWLLAGPVASWADWPS